MCLVASLKGECHKIVDLITEIETTNRPLVYRLNSLAKDYDFV